MVGFVKRVAAGFAALCTMMLALPATGEEPAADPRTLKCDMGPLRKTYGATDWLVFSCVDNRTLLIVSAPGNPATPFYFVFTPHGKGHQLSAEGTGRKDTTTAAFIDLKLLSEREIADLIKETKLR